MTNDAALHAFLAEKSEFDRLLTRLREASADHFDMLPEEVNWGHVGDLRDYLNTLRQMHDRIYREGEHAN